MNLCAPSVTSPPQTRFSAEPLELLYQFFGTSVFLLVALRLGFPVVLGPAIDVVAVVLVPAPQRAAASTARHGL